MFKRNLKINRFINTLVKKLKKQNIFLWFVLGFVEEIFLYL